MPPRVSVIIPTFQRPHQLLLLERAIRSVLAQTDRDFEILVVENGSGAEARSLLDRWIADDVRIRYVHCPEQSAAVARNAGVELARGRYIAMLDDDDEWLPTKLERQIAHLEHAPESVGLVTCRAVLVSRAGEVVGERPTFRGVPTLQALVDHGCVIHSMSCVMIRRGCFDAVGPFEPRYHIVQDYEFYVRLARHYQVAALDEPLVRYHFHDGNITRCGGRHGASMWQEMIAVLKTVRPAPVLGVTSQSLRRAIRYFRNHLAREHYTLAMEAMGRHGYREAARHYVSAVSHDVLVGSRVRLEWSRFRHPFFKVLRPYLAAMYCGWQSVVVSHGR